MSVKRYIYWGGLSSGKRDILLTAIRNNLEWMAFSGHSLRHGVPLEIDGKLNVQISNYGVSKSGEVLIEPRKPYVLPERYFSTTPSPQVALDAVEQENETERTSKIDRTGDFYNLVPSISDMIGPVTILCATPPLSTQPRILNHLLSLENVVHIVPYRILTPTSTKQIIEKINIYEYGDYFELYKNNKSEAFEYLDTYVTSQRVLEKILIANKKEIKYYNLDRCDYELFDFKLYTKKNISDAYFDLTNPEIKRRYDLAYSIAQEYLDTRCLTDTRIRAACIDGIEV